MRNNKDFYRRDANGVERRGKDGRVSSANDMRNRKSDTGLVRSYGEKKAFGEKQLRARRKSDAPVARRTSGKSGDGEGIRLNRYLSNSGICSRRDADIYIRAGVVKVNGTVVTEMGTKVMPGDEVRFNGAIVRAERKVYILLNKPKDTVTTMDDPQGRKTVMDLVVNACKERVFPVGRLDRNTVGVLLLTNDGELAAQLTHPRYHKKKIYHVFLSKALSEEHRNEILNGFVLDDGFIKADSLEYVQGGEGKQIGIEIHSGRNRIVRRIFEHFGYGIEKLDRVYFAGLTKYKLPRGKWRFLTDGEIGMLKSGRYD